MNTKVIFVIMTLGWMPMGQASEGADRVEYSEQMEMRIDRLLAEAMGQPRLADEKFREAERLLAENKNKLNPLTIRFIQISLAQKRGRVSAGRWQADKTDNNSRLTGQKLLGEALAALTAFGEQAENVATALETQLGEEVSESEQWRQASSYIVRTEYAMAWTRYYLGLVSNDDRSKNAYLAKAREGFGHFTQGGIQNHPIIAECFLGLGMCYFEQARYQTVAELLEMTRPAMASWPSAPVPIALFKRITYLRIKALRELPSHLTVTQAAGQYFNLIPADKSLDAMELEILLWWAGSAAALID
ncbi:MAG: hypothetical protein K9M57_08845, partial [Phycisphaerae bacterium]|nr:hypothetical protein [Phycisphaerae bacterium]